jgi:prevent-host-death family protein
MSEPAFREITQRELRNDSGAILRAVESGETFIVTRNGTPIAELHPLRRQTFIATSQLLALLGRERPIDADQFFADLDDVVDQELPGE